MSVVLGRQKGPEGPRVTARPLPSPTKLTYDDFLLFPDDGNRHELIDGEHYVTPSPNLRHQDIFARLHLIIGAWLEANPRGRLFYAPLDTILSRFDVVEPDLLYVSNERATEILGQFVTGAPDLVIEIASPGTRTRDETIKRRLYERSGVREYWVVDPELDAIRVHRRSGGRFNRLVELSADAGDILRTDLLAGLDVHLTRVFLPSGRPECLSRTRASRRSAAKRRKSRP